MKKIAVILLRISKEMVSNNKFNTQEIGIVPDAVN